MTRPPSVPLQQTVLDAETRGAIPLICPLICALHVAWSVHLQPKVAGLSERRCVRIIVTLANLLDFRLIMTTRYRATLLAATFSSLLD